MRIDFLYHVPQYQEQYVDELWHLWSDDFVMLTKYKCKVDLLLYIQSLSTNIPCAYVMHDNNRLIGGCLIDVEDMGMHPWLSPWLANIVILPEYQNKGHGTFLVSDIVKRYETLYLWTFNERLSNFYKRFGFFMIDIVENHGCHENLIVMEYKNSNVNHGVGSSSDITQS